MNPYDPKVGSWNRIILVCCLITGGFIFFFIISTLGQKLMTKNEAKLYNSNADEESVNMNITTIPNNNIEIDIEK